MRLWFGLIMDESWLAWMENAKLSTIIFDESKFGQKSIAMDGFALKSRGRQTGCRQFFFLLSDSTSLSTNK